MVRLGRSLRKSHDRDREYNKHWDHDRRGSWKERERLAKGIHSGRSENSNPHRS